MSDDLVKRLRDAHNFMGDPLLQEAADEIERLRAAWERYNAASPEPPDVVGALEFYACECPDGECEVWDMESVCCGNKARALIAQLKGENHEKG